MQLATLDGTYKVVKLEANAEVPSAVYQSDFFSVTKTEDELSVVIRSEVPVNSNDSEDGWKVIKIEGILDFSMVGVISKISNILAVNGISIFVVSTYNTDYILVKHGVLAKAIDLLDANGYLFS